LSSAHAASSYLGYIQKVGTRGNGTIFIELNAPIGLPQCTHSQIEIAPSQAAAKQLLAIALAAYLSQSRVYIQTDDCLGAYPTLSGQDSWLYPTD
jgi:hypothetical protein